MTPPSIGGVALDWVPTAHGADFLRYELALRDPADTRWDIFAYDTVEAISDIEYAAVRRGVAEQFVHRVRLADGTVSAWSTPLSLTVPDDRYTRLISPDAPEVDHFVRLARPVNVTFPRDQAETDRHGRRYPTVDSAPTDRGIRFDGRLHLLPALLDGASLEALFDRLRAALDADAGTFALLRPGGLRTWVRPIFTTGEITLDSYASAGIRFVEVADRPPIVIVEAA